jgi:periplasmic iron binding protein
MRSKFMLFATASLLSVATATTASAAEYPIGKPVTQANMEVSAVYLQPIAMEPEGMMLAAAKSDVHLEADIHATAGNKNGFPDGEWVPSLQVAYHVIKLDSGQHVDGMMMMMVANDGPHYGDNVKLFGPGKYQLKMTISPPGPDQHFGRHVDKETGVAPWFKPFDVSAEFTFAGTGKKGAY